MVHYHFAKTACLKKIWFSSYGQKRLSVNQMSVFFNRQYFINKLIPGFDICNEDRHDEILISGFDFWNEDRHECKKEFLLTGFMKKLSYWAYGPFLAQKWRILITKDPQ